MNKDFEEDVQELVRRSAERTQQNLKLAAQAETMIRRYQRAKLEPEDGWVYLLITISVIAFIYTATIR